MKSIIILFAFIGISVCQGSGRTSFQQIGQFECEGKDGLNYTYISQWTLDSACSFGSFERIGTNYLITSQQNGKKIVNVLSVLAESIYFSGAYYQDEALYLVATGNLEGKYLYFKEIALLCRYLKKCSPGLGYSYISTKSHVLLIADKLDLNIFLNPTGAFETFKKSATTICQGKSINV